MFKIAQYGNSAVINYNVTNEFVMNDGTKGKITQRVVVFFKSAAAKTG